MTPETENMIPNGLPKISWKEYLRLTPTKKIAFFTFSIIFALCIRSFVLSNKVDTLQDSNNSLVKEAAKKEIECKEAQNLQARVYEAKMEAELRKRIDELIYELGQRGKSIDYADDQADKALKVGNRAFMILKQTNKKTPKS